MQGSIPKYFSVERGVPTRRGSAWRSLAWALSQAVIFCLGLIISPVALLLDIGRVGQRLGKAWVVSYLVGALLASGVTWSVQGMLAAERQRVVEIVTDYSEIKAELVDVPFYDLIAMHALRHNLDPALVAAVVRRESQFDPEAVSVAGARGLMQISPVTWRYVNTESPCGGRHMPPACGDDCIFDPAANIAVGTIYLRTLLDEFEGDVVFAFAAYNAGPTAVRRYSGGMLGQDLPPYRETRRFVRDVLRYWLEYRRDPPPVELDPARLRSLTELDGLMVRVSFGYWVLFLAWAVFKIPWG